MAEAGKSTELGAALGKGRVGSPDWGGARGVAESHSRPVSPPATGRSFQLFVPPSYLPSSRRYLSLIRRHRPPIRSPVFCCLFSTSTRVACPLLPPPRPVRRWPGSRPAAHLPSSLTTFFFSPLPSLIQYLHQTEWLCGSPRCHAATGNGRSPPLSPAVFKVSDRFPWPASTASNTRPRSQRRWRRR